MLKNLKYQKNGSRRKKHFATKLQSAYIFDDESVNGKSQTARSLIRILRITSSF